MSDLVEMVKRYSENHKKRLKNIAFPLSGLGLKDFGYFVIEEDGRFGNLCSQTEELDYFYQERLFQSFPYLIHPKFLRSGSTIVHTTPEETHRSKIKDVYGIGDLLLIIKKHETKIEAFLFDNAQACVSHIDLLNHFMYFFKKEAEALISRMMVEGFNLKKEKGEDFFKCHDSLALLNKDLKRDQFLKKISPLSKREYECLQLIKSGHSAPNIAQLLKLSPRTVESYIESIKNKLNCQSKSDLIQS